MNKTDLSGTPESNGSETVIRPAVIGDVPEIMEILQPYIEEDILLPVSVYRLFEHIRYFVVGERDGQVIGCGSLVIIWHDLAEVRSLAVRRGCQGGGIGGRIVDELIAEAEELGVARVFALTYETGFFGRHGFEIVDRDTLPHKVWKDCTNCARFTHCDEIAMARTLIPEDQRAPEPALPAMQQDPTLIMPSPAPQ